MSLQNSSGYLKEKRIQHKQVISIQTGILFLFHYLEKHLSVCTCAPIYSCARYFLNIQKVIMHTKGSGCTLNGFTLECTTSTVFSFSMGLGRSTGNESFPETKAKLM
jgi:hypothetical protein